MSKKVRSLLLLLILLSVLFTSCTATNSDPFEKDDKTKEDGDAKKDDPPEDDGFVQTPPPADFYGMTSLESLEKYGALGFLAGFQYFDKIDSDKVYDKSDINRYKEGEDSFFVLNYREYPDGEPHFACADPLCTHKDENCPFFNIGSFAVFEHKIFYGNKESGDVFMYSLTENKATKIAEDCLDALMIKYPGRLYMTWSRENKVAGKDEFEIEYCLSRIFPDGRVEQMGNKLGNYHPNQGLHQIYKDRYICEAYFINTTARIDMTDIETGKTEIVFEQDYPELSEHPELCSPIPDMRNSAVVYTLYDDRYYLVRINICETDGSGRRSEFWLVDLSTGEKRMLTSAGSEDVYQSMNCLYSDRCIMYRAQRKSETDPLVVHFLFPETGEEEVYDIGKAAAEAGVTIPMTSYIHLVQKGAILFQTTYLTCKNGYCKTFEYDLKSGKLYCYDLPDAEEITGD